jgi:hypothetical protein
MLDQMQVTSLTHPITLSPVHSPDEQETGPLPSPMDFDSYVWLCVGGNGVCMVSPPLMEGYLAMRTWKRPNTARTSF